jgi:preprotein translocase subunit SecG
VSILTAILNTLVVIICLFLICLILIQRGKGGGLAGAFGGVGGSSAFGTKAGDVFTRVTIIVASVWILLSLVLVILYNRNTHKAFTNTTTTSSSAREVITKSKKSTTGSGTSTTTPPELPLPLGPESTTVPSSPAPAGTPVTPLEAPK